VLYLGIHLALNTLAMVPTEYTCAARYHNLPDAQKCGRDIEYHRQLIKNK